MDHQYSLFIQPASLSVGQITSMMEHVGEVRRRAGGDHIYNIVIDMIAPPGSFEMEAEKIDALLPFFPGQTRRAMDNLFVGTGILEWQGDGSPYAEGVKSPSFRANQIAQVNALARQFQERYGDETWFHWYVSFEAVVNWWTDESIRRGYEEILTEHVRAYHQYRPNASVMFSPAMWAPEPPAGIGGQIAKTFGNVERRSAAFGHRHGINWCHIQDMFGRDWVNMTPSSLKRWFDAFDSYDFASLRVNAELFESHPTWRTGDPVEVRQRFDTFTAMGMPLGACFELRYWYQIEQALGRVDAPMPTPIPDPIPSPSHASSTTLTITPEHPAWNDLRSLVETETDRGESLQQIVVVGIHAE